MLDQYIPLRLIGQGSYGRALLVRDRSDASSLWVIKQVPIRRIGNGPPVELESQLLSSVHHPHIIQMRESFIDHGLFNIVTEFAEGGDLETLVRARRLLRQERWSESQIWRWLQQLSSALALLHLRGIVHRDIKPSNVFTTADGSVKLGDFGIARVLCRGAKAHTVAGTPLYTSPEICAGTPYDERTDLWSIGCLLYEVMTLAPPFVADRPSDLMRRIARADYAPIDPANYSIKLIALVARLLSVRPESRPSAADLLRECAQSTAGLHAAMLRPGARRAPDRPVLGAAVAVQDKPTSDIAARRERELADMRRIVAALKARSSDTLTVSTAGGGERSIAAIPYLVSHLERHLSMQGLYDLRQRVTAAGAAATVRRQSPYAEIVWDIVQIETRMRAAAAAM